MTDQVQGQIFLGNSKEDPVDNQTLLSNENENLVDNQAKQHKQKHKEAAPKIDGYKKIWVDEFIGPSKSGPNPGNWDNIVRYPNSNAEVQAYTGSIENVHLSGEGELVIIPKKSLHPRFPGAAWESGRLEGKHAWACEPQEKMIFQAEIKLGDNPRQLGIWPAFWALGHKMKRGISWPFCGEWDIMEVVNSSGINHGTVHFSYDEFVNVNIPGYDAGNDWQKFSRTTPFKEGQYHTFAFRVNRTPSPWQEEVLTWYVDGHKYFELTGADVGKEEQWKILAHNAYFPLLNVAVGGGFPDGAHNPGSVKTPTAETQDGIGSGMKVRYVAVYKSNK